MSVSQFPPARLFGSASKLRHFSHIPLIGRPPPCTVVSGCREFLALFFCVLSRQMGFSARFSRVIPARTSASLRSLLPTLLLRNPQIQFLMLGLRPVIAIRSQLLCEGLLAGDPSLPAAVFGGGSGFVHGGALRRDFQIAQIVLQLVDGAADGLPCLSPQ